MEEINLIDVQNLVKSYGEKEVLTNVTFDVKKQEIFALLGRKRQM
jgi:ABC-type multidrug transport system ATPase subunit